ncbi:MAG: cold-shock protein [Chloroflexi bacterium]|nr:cold-shock protein [Chloroflexota bacterium]|tara:strand:+ start:3483 stop:3686 length:204 start_codon:yes stop_codon:yes gene_type:complete
MPTGKIKWFNPTKGYGFINNDDGGKDVFVHISAVKEAGIDNLEENDAVEFEIGENRGKENAINLKKI